MVRVMASLHFFLPGLIVEVVSVNTAFIPGDDSNRPPGGKGDDSYDGRSWGQ